MTDKTYVFLMICLIISFFPLGIKAGTGVGTAGAQFLKIGPGARVDGMGSAFSAIADDVTAVYWNPAGISQLEGFNLSDTHTYWIADTRFNYLALATPVDSVNGTLGLSLTLLTMPEMQITTYQQPDGTGLYYDARDSAVSLAYSRQIKTKSDNTKLFLGINAKYIHQRIHHESAKGVAIDVGTLYHTGWKDLRIGITFSNFGPDMHFSGPGLKTDVSIIGSAQHSEDKPIAVKTKRSAELDTLTFPLPSSFRLGIAFDAIRGSKEVLTFAIDSHHPNDNTERMHLGVEYVYKDSGSIRAGYKLRLGSRKGANGKSVSLATEDQEGVSLGLGYKTDLNGMEMNFDYAFANFGRLQQAHRVTLGLSF